MHGGAARGRVAALSGQVTTMGTKIEDFLKEKKIDPRRIIAASVKIERLQPEDRAIRLIKRLARGSEDAAKKKEASSAKKPRSGRPVTDRTLSAALQGKPISGPAKTRVLRAVNRLLEQKKQEKVELSALFELPKKGGAAGAEAAG
ncbi:hypothetical protein WMF27_29040 [Sorangium sp. So ce281]|uniref:hypothetical protein n=1 Tax=unclassified Sorangium TaxID=2621164 RepID=UPI003F634D3F